VADLKDLLGTWTMLSWKKETVATGETVDGLGPDPVGYITYGADGRMHAIVVRRDRPAPETLPPTDTERLRLFDSMIAYSGTYTLDNEKSSTTSMCRGIRLSQSSTTSMCRGIRLSQRLT